MTQADEKGLAKRALPPVECCRANRPSQTANCRRRRERTDTGNRLQSLRDVVLARELAQLTIILRDSVVEILLVIEQILHCGCCHWRQLIEILHNVAPRPINPLRDNNPEFRHERTHPLAESGGRKYREM